MTDECVLVGNEPLAVNFTSATAIEKGAVLKFVDNAVASLSAGDNDICAGIAQSESLSTDTSVSVWQSGMFRGVAGVAGVVFGESLITDPSTSSTNRLVKADSNSTNLVGRCLQTAASGNSFLFELNPRTTTHG